VALAIIGLLNSGLASAYYLRLAFTTAQRPAEPSKEINAPSTQVGIAVGAALLFATAATLVLGIIPGEVLHATESGAHTLQAPPSAQVPPTINATQTNP